MAEMPIPFLASGERYATNWIQALQNALPEERIVAVHVLSHAERIDAALAIVANPDPADLAMLPNLRWVHSVWAGVDGLLSGLAERQLPVVRLIDPRMAATMAESVLAWTLYLHRDMPAYARQQQQKIWRERPYRPAESRTVSVLGLGALGSACARRLVQAGFRINGWSLERKDIVGIRCFSGRTELPAMLAQTDILVILLPLTDATRTLVDSIFLATLPRGSALINFARGPIIDENALYAALNDGHLGHAVLDVFAVEPLPAEHWCWHHPSVTVLPHCSGPTDRESASAIVAEAVRRYRQSGEIPASVDRAKGY